MNIEQIRTYVDGVKQDAKIIRAGMTLAQPLDARLMDIFKFFKSAENSNEKSIEITCLAQLVLLYSQGIKEFETAIIETEAELAKAITDLETVE